LVKDFLANKPDLLNGILKQAKQPLKDAAAVNSTRWALFIRLKETGLLVETGTGGRTKYNGSKLGLPKTHWLDAACVGVVERLRILVTTALLIAARGWGTRQMCTTKNLRINGKAKPTRRVWIAKPGRDEKRPLGIPVMEDRAKQKLVELVLDPEWEARFEPNSYGFRKGRSCYDAIDAINSSIQKKPKWVLDADIASCFDRINHQALMGLELKPSKTKITHTLNGGKEYETGFDFLGFHIQQFEVGKHQSRTKDKIKRIGFNFKTIITPSKQKVQAHLEKIHNMVLVGKAKVLPQVKLIANLNPVLRGWANYYKTVNSSVIYHKLDHLMYLKLRRWAKRRHSSDVMEISL
jgi:hypothetical protein